MGRACTLYIVLCTVVENGTGSRFGRIEALVLERRLPIARRPLTQRVQFVLFEQLQKEKESKQVTCTLWRDLTDLADLVDLADVMQQADLSELRI